MRNGLHYAAIALALFAPAGIAAAQNASPTVDPSTAPDLKLNADQKHTIYLSISNQKQKETAPLDFRAAVGATVPASIDLQPLPKTIVELIPQMKEYQYAMVANQVLLVNPKSKQVVEVIND
jgi:hypothetical protein